MSTPEAKQLPPAYPQQLEGQLYPPQGSQPMLQQPITNASAAQVGEQYRAALCPRHPSTKNVVWCLWHYNGCGLLPLWLDLFILRLGEEV
ncbi:hypothetical protein D9758_000620 [Tetrapyrgos nigripes]|uniref:Uncharacterized protein n=1 Tax=Tetrapyrgos nigripes TaxID=182062 RepID=A0A8H5GZ52_9AGAR|nr:hypothetical protein D9758_000620 [Tetrapyrgos nigripes]